MSNLALINDCHIGVRNDSPIFLEHHKKFFTETFIPELINHKVQDVLILGDFFDRRKYSNFNTVYEVKKFLFDELLDKGFNVWMIVGNHDIYYKNTNRINSPELLLNEYPNINVYTEPTVIDFDGLDIGLVPWINSENYSESIEFINKCPADILMGHFEINGFEMYKDAGVCLEGMDRSLFSNYEYVFSGHFHQPSNEHGIYYLGAPMQFTWSDYGCPRGFHIFNTDKRELKFIKNPIDIFQKIFYDEELDVMEYDYSRLENCSVRVLVGEKESQQKFDLFVDKLQQVNTFQLDIVDNSQYHFVENPIDEDAIKSEDTLSIVNSYIDGLEISLDSDLMRKYFKELYLEALVEMD